ncbi:Cytochrome P450 3A24 [Halotydeus destructor]|nr:Cytochrome P450 3A24 [Halotydeus destructor]
MQYFERIVQKAIRERRANQIKAHDFLQLLIDIWDDDAALDPKSKMITEAELVPQAIAFLSAGHDTTTVWLAVTFYLLALNPDCQQRLHEELNSITDLDYDKLTDNQYLDAVVHESLRMYSPATLLGRLASDDYLIPGTDITIPKGTEVQIPIWSVHYDPDNYTDPGKFDPMRFMPENKDRLKPCTFLPFGSGIRNCIGQRFSFLETKVAVAEMIMNFEFFKTDKTPLKPVFKGGSGQLDFDPLYVGVRARQ